MCDIIYLPFLFGAPDLQLSILANPALSVIGRVGLFLTGP